MQRIVVVGATGSGKTTLASDIARRLGFPHIEIDAIHWGPNWAPIPEKEFRLRMDEATRGDRWVVDGNYGKVRDIVWGRADTLVWLDYPLWLIWWRLLRRSTGRVFRSEQLWNSNRETVRGIFFSRDSLFLWLFQSYPKQKREYPRLIHQPEYIHLILLRFHSPKKAEQWLAELSPS
jgi:adenylate kinase family enzyme